MSLHLLSALPARIPLRVVEPDLVRADWKRATVRVLMDDPEAAAWMRAEIANFERQVRAEDPEDWVIYLPARRP